MSDASIAAAKSIPIDFVRAIRAVESGGDPRAVRFEPHVFWRIRKGLPDDATGPQIRAALSQSDLNLVPYTPGNTDWRTANHLPPCRISRAASCSAAETNEAAMNRAMAVSAVAGMQATSYGLFQVLGAHLLALYGNDPVRALAAFRADPTGVSEALLMRWLDANPRALAAARAKDVLGFVQRYNGCGDNCDAYVAKFEHALRGGGGGIVATFLVAGALAAAWKWLG